MSSRARRNRGGVKKRQPFLKVLIVLAVLVIVVGIGGIAAVAVGAFWLQDLPDYKDAKAYNVAEKTKVYASDGTTLLAEFYLENREPVTSLNDISRYVVEGTVATEDERFYEHNGVDIAGIMRAVVNNITGGATEGASTITQQFVRNTILADEAQDATLKRKVREAFISLNLEGMYDKNQILLMYLNTINYGQGAYGIEAASQLYFSKSAKDLTIPEAATLIGIPQSPTYNNPIDNPDNCLNRRNLVLDRMRTHGVITQEQYDEAKATPIELNVTRSENADGLYKYKYFTSYVRETLLEQFSVDEVFKGGLRVTTTLDPQTQDYAEEAMNNKLKSFPDNIEGALVAVDPDNGFIRAMIGGRDYDTNQFNLATQAERQPGSSFKTFTLLAALADGVSPNTNLDCSSHVKIGNWEVENYGGHSYGTRSIASAYAVSSNTGFAELVTEIGADKVVEMAKKCGIESQLDAYPSITLGAEEVTVREMAQAYATIANGGIRHEAVCIEQIKDSQGTIIFQADTKGEKVLDTVLTQAATEVMEGVITHGTGRNAALWNSQPVAGKTGTSENWRDKWFCGITPQMSVAIWLGARDEVKMPSWIAADGIFGDFMRKVLQNQPIEEFPESEEKLEYTTTDFGKGSSDSYDEDTGVSAEGEAASEDGDDEEYEDDEETTPPVISGGTTGSSSSSGSGSTSSGNTGSTGGSTSSSGSGSGSGTISGGNTGSSSGGSTSTGGGTTSSSGTGRAAA